MRKLVVLAVLLLIAGCAKRSAPTTHLAGAVTIGGQPVPADAEAALSFAPVGGGESVSVPITAGRYDSPKTPQGSVLVRFSISRPIGPVKISERTGKEYRDIENMVPAERAAGITIDVGEENLNQDFKL